MKRLLLIASLAAVAALLPQPMAAQQQTPPAQEQKKPGSKQTPSEKAKPTPPREAKTPAQQPEGKTPEKSPLGQTQRPDPTQPREGKDSRPPAPEKQSGEQEARPPAAGAPTPAQAEKAQETPTVTPTPAQPTPTAQPSPEIEETPARVRATEKPIQEATPQTTQGQAGAPAPVPSTPATGADQTPWSFRREMEALAQTFSLWKILLSILFLLLGYLANKFVALLAERAGGRRNVYAERLRRVAPLASFGIWFAIVLVIVQIFTHSPLALALLIAVAALALAFASQPLLRDLVGGLVILFERPFRLGDRVRVGDHQGEVKKIGLRAFQLASSDGALIAVPNMEALRQPVVNASGGTVESQVTIDIPLPRWIELESARRIAYEAAIVSPYACIHKPIEVYLDGEYQNDLRARIVIQAYVFDARYERQLKTDTVERAMRGFQSLRRATSDAKRLAD